MNNIINYYYGINLINIYEYKNIISFNYNGVNYYFVRYDRDKNIIKSLLNICVELRNRGIFTNELVCNRFNKYLTPYGEGFFVLVKENVREHKIDINDILYIQNNTVNIFFDKNLIRTNTIELWKNKIDFYEKKSVYLNKKSELIKNTLDYYIGLGENAIMYLANNSVKINNIVLSHQRLNDSRESIVFYNPLNYILDSRARDIADYIKLLFFYDQKSVESILSIFKYINFSREEYILLVSRMLFPTYYFDLIDKIIIFEEDETILKKIIDKNDNYINLIKQILYYINYSLRMNIPVIEWIIKK